MGDDAFSFAKDELWYVYLMLNIAGAGKSK